MTEAADNNPEMSEESKRIYKLLDDIPTSHLVHEILSRVTEGLVMYKKIGREESQINRWRLNSAIGGEEPQDMDEIIKQACRMTYEARHDRDSYLEEHPQEAGDGNEDDQEVS